MSWSHYMKGPALDVAKSIEKEAEGPQKYLEHVERSLHARAVALIIVSCHAQPKDGWVYVKAFGHGGPNEQNISVTIQAVAPEVVEFKDDQQPAQVEVSATAQTEPAKPPKSAKLK